MNSIEIERQKVEAMKRTEQSQYLENIPTQWLTTQEIDYMLAQILHIPTEVATDNVIGGYMTYYHMEHPPIWLDWKEVGPCIESYSIQWKKDGDNYIAYNAITTGYPQKYLSRAIKLCIIRHEYGDVCTIKNIPEWKLRVSNHYDQTVLDLRIKDYLKKLEINLTKRLII
jgi:hypothetical protein